ncbi:MAG: hypothetical protein HQM13_11770 [SAR324 cluster bacterium]|nr:hypothetical protein [SAR324 cluster bacterium]
MKMLRIVILCCVLSFLLWAGIRFLPHLFDTPGSGRLVYAVSHETGNQALLETVRPFQFIFNNQSQEFYFNFEKKEHIQEIRVQFSTFWPFLLELEEIRYLNMQGALIGRIDFKQREGGNWKMWRAEQIQNFLFTEKNLEKLADEGLDPELITDLSTLSGQSFSSKKELHDKLKTLAHPPDWRERGTIRGMTQQAHYWVPYNGADLISSEPPPPGSKQIGIRFRPVIPKDLGAWWQYGEKALRPLWLFGFIAGAMILALFIPKWTGRPWHLD